MAARQYSMSKLSSAGEAAARLATALRTSFQQKGAVIPGDRREIRDPCRKLYRKGSGMDPGSAPLRGLSGMTRTLATGRV